MALGKKNPPPPEVAEQFIAAEKSHFGVIILHKSQTVDRFLHSTIMYHVLTKKRYDMT